MSDPFTTLDGKVVCVGDTDSDAVEIGGGISPEGFAVVSAFCDGYLWAGYLRDAAGIWWFHSRNAKARFVTADADGFRVVDDDYGLDSRHVYLEDRQIPDADPATFRLVENGTYFSRDRNRLYVKDGSHFFHFGGLDMETLVANGPFVGDLHNLYHFGSSLTSADASRNREQVQYSLDDEHDMLLKDWFARHHPNIRGWWHPDYPASAEGAVRISGNWYHSKETTFYREVHEWMRGTDETFSVLRGVDPESFEVLDDDHARDATSVFCRHRRIEGAQPSTFKPLGRLMGVDRSAVYYNGYRIEGVDPDSFFAFDTDRAYGKDQNAVYAASFGRTSKPFGHPDDILMPLAGASPESFQAFGTRGAWAADASGVYLHGERKKKLDATSFRFLCETGTNSWAQDDKGLYRSNGTMQVAGIDGATFVRLNDFWGRDDAVVFSFVTGTIQKAMDAGTFEVTDNEGGARDAAATYRIESGAIKKKR